MESEGSFTINYSLESCIWQIRNLPDLYTRDRLGINPPHYLDNGDDALLFNDFREAYIAIGTWLEYDLLDQSHLKTELNLTHKRDYKPLADRVKSFYYLAEAILSHPYGKTIEPGFLRNPANWMLFAQCAILASELSTSGYSAPANPVGKSKRYANFIKNSEPFFDDKIFRWERSKEWGTGTSLDALLSTGYWIAIKDGEFGEKHWLPFEKNLRRCERDLRDGSLKIRYLDQNRKLKNKRREKICQALLTIDFSPSQNSRQLTTGLK
uniref:Uncharacterized protein n=1 Tax=Cyanothece sp. (strain PCC 7425 / ATCC 29141) TaxID=395961 RepID=B8HUB2_CYAP4